MAKKSVTRKIRAERRARAEERQAAYDALTPAERFERFLARPSHMHGRREAVRLAKEAKGA